MWVVCAIVAREEQAARRRRTVNRSEVLAHRIHVQQLDRAEAGRQITDAAVFDFGVQDTGRDGASWALANRGVPIRDSAELEASPDVALVWALRAAPHYYRRSDLAQILGRRLQQCVPLGR